MNLLTSQQNTKRFGRLPSKDPRSLNYLLQVPRGALEATQLTYKHWDTGLVLDQGSTPQCVEYSGRQYLETSPVRNKYTEPYGSLYKLCQQVDEWEGEDYEGTSVNALFKVLKEKGYVSEYRWAYDNESVAMWLLEKGPMVVGTDWYQGMLEPDEDNFVTVMGYPVGGHAYLLSGTNTRKKCPDGSLGAHRITNSWGRGWGDNGRAWVSYRDFSTLLRNWGEAATATEIKVKLAA
jgi:hypothetical protein